MAKPIEPQPQMTQVLLTSQDPPRGKAKKSKSKDDEKLKKVSPASPSSPQLCLRDCAVKGRVTIACNILIDVLNRAIKDICRI